ncbi:MAG: F0F1 ATP synthase subunit B [Patescibacteria group bacterium]
MESIISTFHIDWKIIVAQAVNFIIVFIVLYIYALKPLSKLMKERSEKISKGIDDAKVNAEVLGQTQKEYDAMLAKARIDAQKVFEGAKKEGEIKKSELLEISRKDVATMIENGKKSLEAEKAKIMEDAKKEIVALAMTATEKIMSEKSNVNNL